MMTEEIQNRILRAADVIRSAKHVTAFTGAGISVESGIPPFRGDEGIWNKYDPVLFDIRHFMEYPGESWKVIKEVFYDCFGMARPNRAHEVLAGMERLGFLKEVITQNIDNLHQDAGSTLVHEFHGNSRNLICTKTRELIPVAHADLEAIPPMHPATGGLLKPDFIFFGEGIPPLAFEASVAAAQKADVFLVIGTTGEVMPAGQIPFMAKENGATIIEVNTTESNYTHRITDIFLTGRASEIMDVLMAAL
jgi:NAD-dependent deacetylase